MIANSDTTNGNTDIEIVGGLIDGNKAGQGAGGTEDSQSMIFFKKCSNVLVHRTTLQNGDFHNIRFKDCPKGIIFSNNFSFDPRHEHLADHAQGTVSGSCRGHIITNNYFENILAGNSHITTINVSDVVISNNTCKKTFDTTSCIAPNGKRSIIANNTIIDGSGTGIILAQLSGADFNSDDSIVTGNIVENCASYGIVSNGQAIKGLVISNNKVNLGGTSQVAGIYIALSSGCNIIGNIVSNKGGNGIYIVGTTALPSTRNRVISNICYNNGQAAGGGNHQAGIQILSLVASGDADRITVEGNTCYDDQGTKTQLYGVRVSSATNCIIRNNDLRDNSTAGYNSAGTVTGTLVSNNIGYVTEAKGATASVADGGTITHGLAATPTVVTCIGSIADEIVAVTAITATTFTVAIRKRLDGTAGTIQTIYWRAEV